MSEAPDQRWSVYIIEASDGRYYTGITVDVKRRWKQHFEGKGGAKFFRGRQPQAILFQEAEHSRSSALRREAQIKKLTRAQKQDLIASQDEEQLLSSPDKYLCKQPR